MMEHSDQVEMQQSVSRELRCSSSGFAEIRQRVVQLNNVGLSLLSSKNFEAALIYFNNAFQIVTAVGTELLESEYDFISADTCEELTGMFDKRPEIAEDFSTPMVLTCEGSPKSSEDAEAWILLASTTLMFNGALGHMSLKKLDKAEQLLQTATVLAEDFEDEHDYDECKPDAIRRNVHIKATLLATYSVLAHVVLQITTVNREGQTERRVMEGLESLRQSLDISLEILGDKHFATARIYVLIGQVLINEGYTQQAWLSFQNALRIYNQPHLPVTSHNVSGVDGRADFMSDIENSSRLLGQGWSYGAPTA